MVKQHPTAFQLSDVAFSQPSFDTNLLGQNEGPYALGVATGTQNVTGSAYLERTSSQGPLSNEHPLTASDLQLPLGMEQEIAVSGYPPTLSKGNTNIETSESVTHL